MGAVLTATVANNLPTLPKRRGDVSYSYCHPCFVSLRRPHPILEPQAIIGNPRVHPLPTHRLWDSEKFRTAPPLYRWKHLGIIMKKCAESMKEHVKNLKKYVKNMME